MVLIAVEPVGPSQVEMLSMGLGVDWRRDDRVDTSVAVLQNCERHVRDQCLAVSESVPLRAISMHFETMS